ncbi:type II toxin-antitoxin system HicB family antitoxin [Desulfococcaceae bacterium HSG8]|nr:type II toxin-antitoxin system HicB family antitoxin [Desulfococcaceae bacterium HSG8]
MRYLIVLEQAGTGFAVQVPDLAVITYGETLEDAKSAAAEAIKINLEAYQETGKPVPEKQPAQAHLENPDFADLLFAFVRVAEYETRMAA